MTCDISKNPRPKRKPQSVITTRGPSLSLRPPMIMPNNPCIIKLIEMVPEVSALLQPNSIINGLKKTPKLRRDPNITIWIMAAAITTI